MQGPRTAARVYRELLAAQKLLFAEDAGGRAAALLETRKRFREHAEATPEQVPELLQAAHDAAGFLLHNVAQTKQNEAGNYGERGGRTRFHALARIIDHAPLRATVLKAESRHQMPGTAPSPLPPEDVNR